MDDTDSFTSVQIAKISLARTLVQDADIYIRTGTSQGRRLIYVFADHDCKEVELQCDKAFISGKPLIGLRSGINVTPVASDTGYTITVPMPEIGFAVLAEQA